MKTIDRMTTLFSALSDPTRLRLLNLMQEGEVCVCFFTEILGEPQPKVSRHLAYLRRAGIVTARRDGKWMHYGIAQPTDEAVSRILDDVRDWLANDATMKRDRVRLKKVCCSPSLPASLQGAPLPIGIGIPSS